MPESKSIETLKQIDSVCAEMSLSERLDYLGELSIAVEVRRSSVSHGMSTRMHSRHEAALQHCQRNGWPLDITQWTPEQAVELRGVRSLVETRAAQHPCVYPGMDPSFVIDVE